MTQEKEWFPSPLRLQEQRSLLAEVRRRDGDACRVCACAVHTGDRKSTYALNYRILDPGTTLTVAGVVVVCRHHMTRGEVQPAPGNPYYTEETAYWLEEDETPAAPVVETEAAADTDSGLTSRAFFPLTVRGYRFIEHFQDGRKVISDLVPLGVLDGDWSARGNENPVKYTVHVTESAAVEGSFAVERVGYVVLESPSVFRSDLALTSVEVNESHESSPSVGAPNSALRDNSNPTEGDHTNQGRVASAPVVETEAADDELLARVRASNLDRKYRRYWVEVSGDTAMELEGLGLIVRHLDKTGKPTIFPITREPESDPGRALSMAAGRLRRGLSSPHLAGAPGFKLFGDDVVSDVGGSHFTVTADDLIGRIIPRVIDALRMSDPAFPRDIELNDTTHSSAVDRKDDLVMNEQASVDNPHQSVDHRILAKEGGVPINSQPGHQTSPSVGAPNGALRDNSNPTEGDLTQGGVL